MKIYTTLSSGDTYHSELIDVEDKESAIRWVDMLLQAVCNTSLIGRLNDIQCACQKDGKTMFESKFDIPTHIINLVLAQYNLRIQEV